jgi:hypothetical protein
MRRGLTVLVLLLLALGAGYLLRDLAASAAGRTAASSAGDKRQPAVTSPSAPLSAAHEPTSVCSPEVSFITDSAADSAVRGTASPSEHRLESGAARPAGSATAPVPLGSGAPRDPAADISPMPLVVPRPLHGHRLDVDFAPSPSKGPG